MLNLGTVKPGSTIVVPFDTFAGSTGAPITMSGFAVGDIKIYKSGGTTERASTSGFTLLDTDGTDFDGITGIQGFSVDLADNTTAGFFTAGATYFIVVSTVTIDSQTVSFVAATFTIGYAGAMLDTTIASLSSQTSFTLTTGPAEDDALNGQWAIIHDAASAVQIARVLILDYTGSTKTVTLAAGATFTAAAGDNISIMGMAALQPTVQGRTVDVTATGAVGIDWGNIENKTTTNELSGTSILYTSNKPLQVYVAPHGLDTNDGLSPGAPKLTIAAALTVARAYYGSELNIFGGRYDLDTTPGNLFAFENYAQFSGLTETGSGTNTRFTIAGDGSENYDTEGHANYLIRSQMTPTTGAAAGTLYRITGGGYVGPDWEFTVSPNFGGNYAANINGKTLNITRDRVRTGVSVRCLGPVELLYAGILTTSNQGPLWIPGEGSAIYGHPKFGMKIKLDGTGFQAGIGQYTANNATLNGTTYGTANYHFGNMGQRNDTGDESDGWYDNYADTSRTGIVGSSNAHLRAEWDSGRIFEASTRTAYLVDSSFVSRGPTMLGGSGANEARGVAMTGGTIIAANSDFHAEAGTDGSYAVFMSGSSTFIALPGCRFSYTGTGKKIKLAGGTFINATGQSIAAGDRDTAAGTYSEVDVETREEAIDARMATSPADVRMILTRTPPTPNVAGVLPVDLTHLVGDADAAAGLTTAGGNYSDFGEFNAKLVDADAGVITTFQAGLATSVQLATVAGYVDTEVAAIKAKTDNLPAAFPANFASLAITVSGEVTAENAGAGGGGNAIITPILATLSRPFVAVRDLPRMPAGSANSIQWTLVDTTGAAVPVENLRLVVYLISSAGDNPDSVLDDTLTGSFKYETDGGGLVVSGDDDNIVTLTHDPAKTATAGDYRYLLWDLDTTTVVARGKMPIEPSILDVE